MHCISFKPMTDER